MYSYGALECSSPDGRMASLQHLLLLTESFKVMMHCVSNSRIYRRASGRGAHEPQARGAFAKLTKGFSGRTKGLLAGAEG